MAFLRKHYEKVILAAFLLVFILLLVWLIMIFSKSMEISEQDLMITPRQANYQQISKADYQDLENIGQQTAWVKAEARTKDTTDYTSLLIPFEISRCPVDKGCGRFIPLSAFGTEEEPGKCPLCGIALDAPKVIVGPDDEIIGQDTDGDGISNIEEVKYGMSPSNPADALYDLDNDGFSNLYEYKQSFTLNDAKSHPPLAERLALKGIHSRQLPMVLKKVVAREGDEKDRWDIQIDISTARGTRSRFERLGNTLKLGNDEYLIKDVIYKTKEKLNPKLNAVETVDVSEIVLQKGDDAPITAVVGERVVEPNPRIALTDYHSKKRDYILQKGEEFTIGSRSTGTEKYVLQDVDEKTNAVTVRAADGTVYPVNSVAKAPIPEQPGMERSMPDSIHGPGRQPGPGGQGAPEGEFDVRF